MLRKVGVPKGHAPAHEAAPATATAAPARPARPSLGSLPKPRRAKPSVPMTGPAAPVAAANRLPDLVRYEQNGDRMRRRWVPGFTRRGPVVPEGWMEEGSPEELAAKKEAGL